MTILGRVGTIALHLTRSSSSEASAAMVAVPATAAMPKIFEPTIEGSPLKKQKSESEGAKGAKGKGSPPQMLQAIIQSVTRDYDQIYTLRLRQDDMVKYAAGQYCHMKAPGLETQGEKSKGSGKGKRAVRHMSFASSPLESELVFSMDLSSGSEFKQRISELTPGDSLQFFKVKGQFVLDPEMSDVVFIAGGIGITPIRSLIMDIEKGSKPVSWQLLHIARTGHLYQSELETLPAPQVRTNRAGCESALKNVVAQKPAAHYFISGSDRFVQGLKEQLEQLGVPETKIRMENFHH
jgi:ferredoxin-NADP reductase